MASNKIIKTGERRIATLLFADLQGFTALSEQMDPEEIDTLMGKIFGLFEEIITSRGGVVEKYIGDALVAVFGVPDLHEDDTARALESALVFLERKHSITESAQGSHDMVFRIGIHCGLVATGYRGNFSVVTGHPMAIAQRLQAAADPDSILVSDAVKERCDDSYEFSGPIAIEAKGIQGQIQAWKLSGEIQAGAYDMSPFVGRNDELADLLRLYVRHDSVQNSGAYIFGEAGIGKTRLTHAIIEKIKLFPDFESPIFTGKAQKYRPVRYGLIADLIIDCLGLDYSRPLSSIIKAITALPNVDISHANVFASLLDSKGSVSKNSDIVLSLFTIFSAIHELHKRLVYPALLLIDNASDMDRYSREFLLYYLKNSKVKPFTIMVDREHDNTLVAEFKELKPIKLGPLSNEESAELARIYWPEVSPLLLDSILQLSGGKPLFIREYSIFAKKNKNLSALPNTIQNMFLANIDKYTPEIKDFIKAMSVFILSFNAEEASLIYEASGGSRDIVSKALSQLLADGILVQHNDRYSFALDVLKKALYSTILNHNKKILHSVVADIMMKDAEHNKLRLIYHLMKAERWIETANVIQNDPARSYVYEYIEYIDALHKRLIKTSPDIAIKLLITKSALYFNSGKLDEAEYELKHVMKVALTEKNELCMAFAYQMICAHNVMSSSFSKALFTGQKALYYYKRVSNEPRGMQSVMRYLALAESHLNNFDAANKLISQICEMSSKTHFEYFNVTSVVKLLAGEYKSALLLIDSGLNKSSITPSSLFFSMDTKLKILWQLCDFNAIAPSVQIMLDAGDFRDDRIAQAQAMLAASASILNDAKTASTAFMQAEYYIDKVRNIFDKIDSLRTLALCHFIAGNIKKAEAAAREALISGLRHSCYYPTFTILILLLEIAMKKNNIDEAKFFLSEASFFFTTGLLLPPKDVILYYYYASKLSEDSSAKTNALIAHKLLLDEKSKLGRPELIANFLSIRSFSEIDLL